MSYGGGYGGYKSESNGYGGGSNSYGGGGYSNRSVCQSSVVSFRPDSPVS